METSELQKEVESMRSELFRAMTQAKDRANIGKMNAAKAKTVNDELEKYNNAYIALKECINHVTKIYKNIEHYAIERKELSMEMLRIAIEKAGYIVPDADTNGIQLKTYEKTARIVNRDGQDINLREGSAFRTVMGMLIRYTLLKAQPDKIQAIFLDEAFSTLSDTTTTAMREYFDIFKDDIIIVGIEQRDILFQGVDKKVFRAVKGQDNISHIYKED